MHFSSVLKNSIQFFFHNFLGDYLILFYGYYCYLIAVFYPAHCNSLDNYIAPLIKIDAELLEGRLALTQLKVKYYFSAIEMFFAATFSLSVFLDYSGKLKTEGKNINRKAHRKVQNWNEILENSVRDSSNPRSVLDIIPSDGSTADAN